MRKIRIVDSYYLTNLVTWIIVFILGLLAYLDEPMDKITFVSEVVFIHDKILPLMSCLSIPFILFWGIKTFRSRNIISK